MKISKIYSNKKEMRPLVFQDGLNVVFGDVEDNEDLKDEHNLGKTSLVHLIDFLLLKGMSKESIFSKFKRKFAGWEFFIELKLEAGKFLTIRRGVDYPTLISFKLHSAPQQDFSEEVDWDYKEIKMFAKKSADAIGLLESYLNFDVANGYSIRKFLDYALRTQYDYADIFKMPEFLGGDIEWKPFLLNLLGFQEETALQKYKIQSEIDSLQKLVARHDLKKNEDVFRLQAVIAAKERERERIREQTKQFDFFLSEKEINTELVHDIETKISKLNAERYRLDYEVTKIQSSLQNNSIIEFSDIEKIFKEAKIYFSSQLKQSYEELVEFNTHISEERAKYLKEELREHILALEELNKSLVQLNKDKSQILSVLTETEPFQKFRLLQEEERNLDSRIAELRQRLGDLDAVESYEKRIESLENEAKALASQTERSLKDGSLIFDQIRAVFGDIFKATMRGMAVLVARVNKEGNPHFESLTFNTEESDELTGRGQGYTATKVQCAAIVLAILSVYSKRRFYKFAYHDGLLEGWGTNPKIRFIEEVRRICAENDIQYVISVIKSDVPPGLTFTTKEKIITLDEKNTLFGFPF